MKPSKRAAPALFPPVRTSAWRIRSRSSPSFLLLRAGEAVAWRTEVGCAPLISSGRCSAVITVIPAEDEGVLEGVLELPDIAGPGVPHEDIQDLVRRGFPRFVSARC